MDRLTYYLSVGTNIEDRLVRIKSLLQNLEKSGFFIYRISSVYETRPMFEATSYPFLNLVVVVKTFLKPEKALWLFKKIEREEGRPLNVLKKERYSARASDIDIIFIEEMDYQSSELVVPHPDFKSRSFVLYPLFEILDRKSRFYDEVAEALKKINTSNDLGITKKYPKCFLW